MSGARWCVVAAIGSVLALAAAGCQYTVRSSVSSTGVQGNAGGERAALSSDGRFAAFDSLSTNLVAGDTNGRWDVFVRDHQTGATSRVSLSSAGTQGNDHGMEPAISADGRYVAFTASASNLVAGDTNASSDVFVHDRQSGATTRESVASGGTQGNAYSNSPAISDDGRYVAFLSFASNLVAGDTNAQYDVFVRDRQTLTTTRASVSTAGVEGDAGASDPAISGDGAVVAFHSSASNLVAGDTNGVTDVFVRAGGTTSLVSRSSGGAQGNGPATFPDLSADGTVVAFSSMATNLVAGDTNGVTDAFVRDRAGGTTTRVSLSGGGVQGNGSSGYSVPQISADGRLVAFGSAATNLVAGDTNGIVDVFVRDRVQGRTTRASTDSFGGQAATGSSSQPALSGDGRYVTFTTGAPLDPADTNAYVDVYLKFAGEPKPKAITPSSQMPGKSVDVTIDGSGFEAGDQVGVSGGGVNVTNVQVVDDSTITATFEILPGASTGARWVAVSRSAGGWNSALGAVGSCVGCFTVSS